MPINLLHEQLINKIAAGEVIERPASVVKELLDNSIDAGANQIIVSIAQGGTTFIEVEDNGHGIKAQELKLAFERHATSKLKEEEDLFHIITMGFRGEALPSIASVSRLEIFSHNADEDAGVYALIHGGKFLDIHEQAMPVGTRIIIRDLFYNVPARKKFLKSIVTEANSIHDLVCRYAVARPDISFTYSNERKTYFKTPGNGSIKDVLVSLYGRQYIEGLVEVDYEGEDYSIQGLISTPAIKRLNRKNQFYFVNNRPIKNPMLYKAVDTAYRGLLISREYPVVALSLKVRTDLVDVNVHPQKTEVRFADERQVFTLVESVLRKRLNNLETNWISQVYKSDLSLSVTDDSFLTRSFKPQEQVASYSIPPRTEELFPRSVNTEINELMETTDTAHQIKVLGQIMDSYILIEMDRELWIIDQHAAHERILFERYKYSQSRQEHIHALVIPLTLQFSTEQMEIINHNQSWFHEQGFELEAIGHNDILLRAAPLPALGNEFEVIMELVEILKNSAYPDIYREMIIRMACRKAIKFGDRLTMDEAGSIMTELVKLDNFKHCPHGRPTMVRLTSGELERMFKRTGA
ncbi:MAG: DNA mismatch repair endonuclease MutL [Syntrophomonadaceae bacterium]|nr:DNA mismatch repair endonuclease MutL [Syntrophomonadaceae bacterium]